MKKDNGKNGKKRLTGASKIAFLGVLTALAVVLSYVESLIPPFTGIPGVKPGLANVAVMTAMYLFGPAEAIGLAAVRIVLCGLSFSGLFSMLYSLAGAALSITVMLILKRLRGFSVRAISFAGGISHNIGQLIVAILVTGKAVTYYLPVLILTGAVAGFIMGVIANVLIRSLSQKVYN